MTSDCVDALRAHADYLNFHVTATGRMDRHIARPQPLLFSGPNCNGFNYSQKHILNDDDMSAVRFVDLNYLKSLFIPLGWRVTLHSDTGESFVMPQGPVTIRNVDARLMFPGTTNKPLWLAKRAEIRGPAQSVEQWKYAQCMGAYPEIVGDRVIVNFKSGTQACDDYMYAYCQSAPDDVACTCIREQQALNVGVDVDDGPSSVIPVNCFGKRCRRIGYQFAHMREQKCNIDLCRQLIDVHGDNIVARGGSVLYCGAEPIDEQVTAQTAAAVTSAAASTPAASTTLPHDNSQIPAWIYILIGAVLLVILYVLPYLILFGTARRGVPRPTSRE